MSVYSPIYHTMVFSPDSKPALSAASSAGKTEASSSGGDGESFFHHILDVINPLQHLPVVSTIYRAITGEHIGPIEKIAGDALYGGLWGAVSSIADVAFESLTGKDMEDTAMAWLKGDDDTAVASAKVAAPTITASAALPSSDMPALASDASNLAVAANGLPVNLEINALTSALSAKGVDTNTAARALYAYRRSMGAPAQMPVQTPVQAPVLASVN
jgi:hypothetical protein